jgi:hypothetical protein
LEIQNEIDGEPEFSSLMFPFSSDLIRYKRYSKNLLLDVILLVINHIKIKIYPLQELNCSKRDLRPRRGRDRGPSGEFVTLTKRNEEMESLVCGERKN